MKNIHSIILLTILMLFISIPESHSKKETSARKRIALYNQRAGGTTKSIPFIPIEAYIEDNLLMVFFLQATTSQTNCTITIKNSLGQIVYDESIIAQEEDEHLITIDWEEIGESLLEIKINRESFYGEF